MGLFLICRGAYSLISAPELIAYPINVVGNLAYNRGHYKFAAACWGKAIALEPEVPRYHQKRAMACWQLALAASKPQPSSGSNTYKLMKTCTEQGLLSDLDGKCWSNADDYIVKKLGGKYLGDGAGQCQEVYPGISCSEIGVLLMEKTVEEEYSQSISTKAAVSLAYYYFHNDKKEKYKNLMSAMQTKYPNDSATNAQLAVGWAGFLARQKNNRAGLTAFCLSTADRYPHETVAVYPNKGFYSVAGAAALEILSRYCAENGDYKAAAEFLMQAYLRFGDTEAYYDSTCDTGNYKHYACRFIYQLWQNGENDLSLLEKAYKDILAASTKENSQVYRFLTEQVLIPAKRYSEAVIALEKMGKVADPELINEIYMTRLNNPKACLSAMQRLQKIVGTPTAHASVLFYTAKLHGLLGETETAKKELKIFLLKYPHLYIGDGFNEEVVAHGEAAVQLLGKYETSRTELKKFTAKFEKLHEPSDYLLGRLCELAGDLPSAIRHYKHSNEYTDDGTAAKRRLSLLQHAGKSAEADKI